MYVVLIHDAVDTGMVPTRAKHVQSFSPGCEFPAVHVHFHVSVLLGLVNIM